MTTKTTRAQDELHRSVNAKALELRDIPRYERSSAAEKNGLWTDLRRWVFRLVKVLLENSEIDADDVTQEILLKSSASLARFKYDSQFTTWLFKITIRTVADARKKIRGNIVSLDEHQGKVRDDNGQKREPVAPTVDIDSSLSVDQKMKEILQILSPKDREILEGRSHGQSPEAIGQSLNMTAEAVRQRSSRVIRRLVELQQQKNQGEPVKMARKPPRSRMKRRHAIGS